MFVLPLPPPLPAVGSAYWEPKKGWRAEVWRGWESLQVCNRRLILFLSRGARGWSVCPPQPDPPLQAPLQSPGGAANSGSCLQVWSLRAGVRDAGLCSGATWWPEWTLTSRTGPSWLPCGES